MTVFPEQTQTRGYTETKYYPRSIVFIATSKHRTSTINNHFFLGNNISKFI